MSDSPPPPLQFPNHRCQSKDDVKALVGPETTVKVLDGHDSKSQEYGDPIARDFMAIEIAPVSLRGWGPDHQGINTVGMHRSLHGIIADAFDEIYALRLPYMLRTSETGSPCYFRYTKNENVRASITKRPEYGLGPKIPDDWAHICAVWDREHKDFEREIDYFEVAKGTSRKRPKKDLLSNHSWGTAIDINPRTNPFKAGAAFDMQLEIVKIMEAHGFYWGGRYHDYMHFEYCLPRPGSQFWMPRTTVCFPFSHPGQRESPIKYLHLNESGRGGFYPLGLRQNLHGGVHLDPAALKAPPKAKQADKKKAKAAGKTGDAPAASPAPEGPPPLVPVHAGAPGYIVAARLVEPELLADKPQLVEALEGQPLGFVLIRHELVEPEQKQADEAPDEEPEGDEESPEAAPKPQKSEDAPKPKEKAGKESVFYSLYMHLASPGWEGHDTAFEGAPWLEKLLRMQYGSVVVLDPANAEDVGRVLWAKSAIADKPETVTVREKEKPIPVTGEDKRTLGVVRKSPEAISEAIERLKQGAVLTFDRPMLPVAVGDIVGFLGQKAGPAGDGGAAQHYLHWEMFSPPGGGLSTVRGKASPILAFGGPVSETRKNNFLEMPSRLLPSEPKEIKSMFAGREDPVLNPVIEDAYYGSKLKQAFAEGKSFAEGSPETPGFFYPVTLKFANPYHFKPDAGAPDADKIKTVLVTCLQNGVPLEKDPRKATIGDFGDTITLPIMVHAGADTIALHSDFFQLKFAPPPEKKPPPKPKQEGLSDDEEKKQKEEEKKAKEREKKERKKREEAFMKAMREGRRKLFAGVVAKRRWRDIVLDHVNEWSTDNLGEYLMARLKAGFFERGKGESESAVKERLLKVFEPLTWWAPKSSKDAKHGEHATLGDGSRHPTIFDASTTFLPKDAHIENMHPVVALWLLDILQDESIIGLRRTWPPDTLVAAEKEAKPLFFGLVTHPFPRGKGPSVGSEMTLAVVEHGYHSSVGHGEPGVAFAVELAGRSLRVVATALYVDGAAVARVRLPFWGTVKYKADLMQAHTTRCILLEAERQEGTTTTAARPVPASGNLHFIHTAGSKPNVPDFTGSILIKSGEPWALEGYLAFECWSAPLKESPDTSKPGKPGKLLFPVVAQRSKPDKHERNGLLFEGDFIVGVPEVKAKGKAKPGSPQKARITDSYVLQDFIGTKKNPVAMATGARFKVAFPLVERLQMLRTACDAAAKKGESLAFALTQLDDTGLVLVLTPHSAAATPTIVTLYNQLPRSDLFTLTPSSDGKTLQLTYSPLPDTLSLGFTTGDLLPVLHRLANLMLASDGEQLVTRPTFIAPNGGHHVFSVPRRMHEDGSIEASADDVRQDAGKGTDLKADTLEFTADRVLPAVHRFGFGPMVVTMGETCVHTRVPLLGPAADWGTSRPRLTLTVKQDGKSKIIPGGRPNQDMLSEDWSLHKWKKTELKLNRWGATLVFKAAVTSGRGLAQVPKPVEVTFKAEPKLLSLDIATTATEVVLTGKAQALPTSADTSIRCEYRGESGRWIKISQMGAAITFDRKSNVAPARWGCVNEEGKLTARISRTAFTPGSYRFIWQVEDFADRPVQVAADGKAEVETLSIEIAPLTSAEWPGAKLAVGGGISKPGG